MSKGRRLWRVVILIGTLHLLSSFRLLKPVLIAIDPGHGGKDPGAQGKVYKEKDITLAVSLKLAELLRKEGHFRVLLTRDTDTFVELARRADTANKANADFFISIHCNANPKKDIHGSETYALGEHKSQENLNVVMRENAAILMEESYQKTYEGFDPNSEEAYIIFSLMQHAFLKQSLRLAKKIEDNLVQKTKRPSRGVKQAGFLVLWRTSMPAVLCEIGFISHPQEEKFLGSPSGQEHIAQAIYQAIKEYIAAGYD
ncbi:MAG: N-acetylmuramoyl-L-alanine amidase [Bacteroidia bacterium]|nr:N-acetylmuramoyl-L-alanine amidase [Bacteroidia bacterium]MDW8134863.1 N-acetylmuramoyl-L-alanine amidase [Bacteroidia bacterium]